MDLTLAVRASNGITFQGGTSTGQTVQDLCGVSNNVPDALLAAQARCGRRVGAGLLGAWQRPDRAWPRASTAISPRASRRSSEASRSYQVPKVDVEISATFQSKPGAQLAANYNVPAAIIAQSLGRAPSGGVANVTVNLVTPGTLYGDRVNELDLRVAKVLKFGSTRTKISLDLYNALNANPVLTYNQTYSPTATTWLTPTSVLAARVDQDRRVVRFLRM